MLLCPVRDCRRVLQRESRRVVCPLGHSFDVARSGYLNLLQPQDSRSRKPGDTAAAVASRRRLHDRGITEPLLRAISGVLQPSRADAILDAGCGEGFYLGNIVRETQGRGHGTDISIPAIDAAARRYPECEWVVANADRFIPYADKSFSIIFSITARMNPAEFRRVLRDDGRLLVAVPSPDDLIELRGKGRDRAEKTLETFSSQFSLIARQQTKTSADLDAGAVQDILTTIYRPLRSEPVRAMRVTLALDLLLFRPAEMS